MSEPVIAAESLVRSFGEKKALAGLSFTVPEGSVFGLVGRNGCGKTTAIKIVLGLLAPDAGRSSVYGHDSLALPAETRRRIGYLSEADFPFADLPVPETLEWLSGFFPAWDWDRAERWVKRFEVPAKTAIKDMSKGERRRAELLLVLAQDPDLLVLDDPTLGLDATVRRDFLRASLEIVREEGKTVLFTSHVLTDVERVVDSVVLVEGGVARTSATLDDLKARTKRVVFPGAGVGDAGSQIVVPGEVSRRVSRGDLLVVTEAWSEGIDAGLRARHPDFVVEDLNLEEIFVEVLGRKLAPEAA